MDNKRILVTGAAGFIGSQLCLRLTGMGHDVIGCDNWNSHLYDPWLKVKRHTNFGMQIMDMDIRDELMLGNLLNDQRLIPDVVGEPFDYVIHLAAHAGVRDSFGKESEYHSNNIDGTQNLINLFENYSPQTKFIYASTSSVYGGTPISENGWKEDFVQAHQLNAYAYTKYINECQFGISKLFSTGLRFFTVYGPWGRPDMALFQFTKSTLDGTPIKVYNYGDMKRDFTYIDDILDGICIVLANVESGVIPNNEIFNIGRGEQVQLMDFISEIEKNVGKEVTKEMVAKHPADTKETWSNTDKLQKLGYTPKVSIAEGVAKFYEWYKNFYDVEET
jgi:UDP-glucuronate 4-epimerase